MDTNRLLEQVLSIELIMMLAKDFNDVVKLRFLEFCKKHNAGNTKIDFETKYVEFENDKNFLNFYANLDITSKVIFLKFLQEDYYAEVFEASKTMNEVLF